MPTSSVVSRKETYQKKRPAWISGTDRFLVVVLAANSSWSVSLMMPRDAWCRRKRPITIAQISSYINGAEILITHLAESDPPLTSPQAWLEKLALCTLTGYQRS